jgi:rSAM/selenodomain-associated transferase 1
VNLGEHTLDVFRRLILRAAGGGLEVLVVFFRRPAPGVGKQRIAADLGAQRALELGRMLLAATIEDAEAWPGPVVLAPAAVTDAAWAGGLLSRPFSTSPQPAGSLGQRINAVDAQLRDAGAELLIYIGSDAPVLDESYYAAARRALCAHDVVLGPAEDGGVTLMGARQAWPDITGLPWSTGKLAEALAARCRDAGMSICYLEPRYDIDVQADLLRLTRDLAHDCRPARRRLVAWLERKWMVTGR